MLWLGFDFQLHKVIGKWRYMVWMNKEGASYRGSLSKLSHKNGTQSFCFLTPPESVSKSWITET